MVIREVACRSILTPSRLPEADYCLNPYAGCAHACVYCYARFMRRFTGHREPWGEFVDVRTNAPARLRDQLRARHREGTVLVGSVTDAYQPLERRYGLTRALLAELLPAGLSVSILTKSDLVLRDADLLARFAHCSVGLTVTTLDDRVRAVLEPRAAPVARRLAALRQLRERGIATYAFVGPILPALTDLGPLLQALQGAVDTVWAEALNLRAGNRAALEAALREHLPHALPGLRAARDPAYWDGVERDLQALCAGLGLTLTGFYRHDRR